MWEIILGGVIALAGSWGAIYFQLRFTRKNRMNEVVAERKVESNAKAYSNIKSLQGHFTQSSPEESLQFMYDNEEWFFDNRLFLPGEYPDLWMEIRTDLRKLARKQHSETPSEELVELDRKISETINRAVLEIYKDMEMEPIPTHRQL